MAWQGMVWGHLPVVVAHTITYILTASGELIRSRQTGLARHRSAERAILQLLLDSLRLVDTAALDACMHCRAAAGAA